MIEREEITDDWRKWPAQRLAWALEAHLIPADDMDEHEPPSWLSKELKINLVSREPIPMGMGYHFRTGYFLLATAGQGPVICGIEKLGPPMTPSGSEDDDDDEDFAPF